MTPSWSTFGLTMMFLGIYQETSIFKSLTVQTPDLVQIDVGLLSPSFLWSDMISETIVNLAWAVDKAHEYIRPLERQSTHTAK